MTLKSFSSPPTKPSVLKRKLTGFSLNLQNSRLFWPQVNSHTLLPDGSPSILSRPTQALLSLATLTLKRKLLLITNPSHLRINRSHLNLTIASSRSSSPLMTETGASNLSRSTQRISYPPHAVPLLEPPPLLHPQPMSLVPLSNLYTSPFAIYFCAPSMIKVLTTAGINPRRRVLHPGSYILKLHPINTLTQSALEDLFRSSRLRGKSEALLVVNISTSLAAGAHWDVDKEGMYCSNDVPIQPSYLHSAYSDNFGQLVQTWGGDTAPSSRPTPSRYPSLVPPLLPYSH